jgi:hypothetical protein
MACSGFPCFMLLCKSNSNFVSLLNIIPLYAIGAVELNQKVAKAEAIHYLYGYKL